MAPDTDPDSNLEHDVEPFDAALTHTSAGIDRPTRVFGPYRLIQPLGEGGMGEVWLAEQLHPIHRQVAIKVVKAGMDTRQVVARFEAERQALALMDHPGIARVFEAGSTPEGRPYFAMEYVRGEPIVAYCDRHRLTTAERLQLFIQVCDAVQHAHQKAIIHRDLKPSNILVTLQDTRPVPKVIDFGVAKATTQQLTDRTLFTELGAFIGTPEYMSPEQADAGAGGRDVDTRTDVYALGVVLYELLTGSLPFDVRSLRRQGVDEIRRTLREVEPPRPSTRISKSGDQAAIAENRRTQPARLAGLVRGDLDWITMRALEKDRARRYQTAHGLALDLRRSLAHEPVSAGPPGAAYRSRRFVRRHRVAVAGAATLVALLVAFAAAMTVQAQRIARERDRVATEAATATQVSKFLIGLFKVSDPSEARGNSVTAREILDKGAVESSQTLSEQPEIQARLQATIGAVYTALGVYGAAVPLLQQAVATQRRLLGEDHPDTLAAANQLANAYWYLGKTDEAEPLYLDVVARRRRTLGDAHPDTLRANFDLGSLYLLQKRWHLAEPLIRATLETQTRVLGADNADTLASQNLLQSLFFGLERYGEAEAIAVRVLESRRRLFGNDHPQTATAIHNLATNYDRLEIHEKAEALYLETIEVRRRVLGETHQLTARSRIALAAMYVKKRRYGDAEAPALAAYQGFSASLGDGHALTQSAVQQLVQLYVSWGRPAKAAEWRGRSPKGPAGIRRVPETVRGHGVGSE